MSKNSNSLTQLALQKFKKNFWGVLSFCFIAICAFMVIFAYLFTPDDTKNANQMHLSIHSKKPGFSVQMLTIPSAKKEEENFLSTLFFGKENTATEIPITSYQIKENKLFIQNIQMAKLQELKKKFR